MRLFEGTEFDVPPTCDRCGVLEEECECPEEQPTKHLLDPAKQKAIVSIEKRKKGKMVTVVSNLDPEVNDFSKMLTDLKNRCGAGGTIRDDKIEIQGKHLESVAAMLVELGYRIFRRG